MAINLTLEVSSSTVIDATVTTYTDPLNIGRIRNYSMSLIRTGIAGGNPIIEVQGSNDNINWINPYTEDNGSPMTFELSDDSNGVDDPSNFLFEHFRIKTIPNGAVAGTLEYILSYENGF